MPQNTNDWMRSLTITSPVLIAALVSVILAATTILNSVEATSSSTAIPSTEQGQEGQGQFGYETTDILKVTAQQIYVAYQALEEGRDSSAAALYSDKVVQISGVLAGWGEKGGSNVLLVSDNLGGAFVRCLLQYSFTDEADEELTDLRGEMVTLTGTSLGFEDGYVIIVNCSSNDIQTESPATVG